MQSCPSCRAEVPAGQRWCRICHTHALDPSVGRLASPGKRFAAFVLDLAIPGIALLAILAAGAGAAGDGTSEDALANSVGVMTLLALGYFIWALILFGRGTTPGKRLLGMWVIKESGQRAGFGTMLFREWIGKWVSGILLGLGYLWVLIDDDRQGWHDRFASTYVISRRRHAAIVGPAKA